MPEVTITLKTIDETSKVTEKVKKNYEGLVPGLEKAGKSIGDFASKNAVLIGTLVAIGAAAKQAYGEYQKYAGEVRDLALATGTSAEEASTLLQVLDDFEIQSGDLTAAMRAMKEKGLVPTIDTLARLSDEYKAIQDPAERLKFAQDNLGRSSAKFLLVLDQGGDTLREYAGEVNKNLILTDEQIKKAERQRLAVDAVSDTWQGLKLKVGEAVGEIILGFEEYIKVSEEVNRLQKEGGDELEKANVHNETQLRLYALNNVKIREFTDGLDSAGVSYRAMAEAVQGEVLPALEDEAKKLEELSKKNQDYLSLVDTLTKSEQDYAENMKDLTTKHEELLTEKKKLISQGYWEEGETIQEVNRKLAENEEAQRDAAEEAELASRRRILAMLEENLAVEGLTTDEMNYLLNLGQQWGIYTDTAVAEAQKAIEEVNNLTNAFNNLPTEKTMSIYINQGVSTYGNTTSSSTALNAIRNARGGGRALGGPVSAGTPYMVGEMGPEMFVPGQHGSIVPNNKLQGQSEPIDWKRVARIFRDTMAGS